MKQQRAGVLVVTLIMVFVLSAAVWGGLAYLSHRKKVALRSAAWNATIPIVEAGIQEALAHLRIDADHPTADRWATTNVAGGPAYWKKRTISGGSYFLATICNYSNNNPIIYSTGFVPSPLEEGAYVSHRVRALVTNPPISFSRNIAAVGQVTLCGNTVIDGYDSRSGPYDKGTNRNASGGIVTNSKLPKGINVGTAEVLGRAATGPGGTVFVTSGAVGDRSWVSGHTGMQSGWVNNDVNVSYPSNSPPSGSASTPTISSTDGSNIVYLASGLYKTSSFTTRDKTKPIVVTGNATLWVTGDFTVSGSGYVYIAAGASLTLYIGGQGVFSGGGIINSTGNPLNFTVRGLSSNNLLACSGSANLIGTINAPQADVTVSGGAGFYGAVICGTFTSSDGSGVHYDQALEGAAGTGPVVISWAEM
jgi:hypothetical protein